MGEYLGPIEEGKCGNLLPTATWSFSALKIWWDCAYKRAVVLGVCSDVWHKWHGNVYDDVISEEGASPYRPQGKLEQQGDYIKILIWDGTTYHEVGTYKWKCPEVPTGAINVSSTPTGAHILIDMIDKGLTNKWVDGLTVGVHRIVITKEGYAPQTRDVTVIAYATVPAHFDLVSIGKAKGEITLCNINGSSCPNCGQANSGDKISVIAEMKNVGAVKGEFRFYIYDQDGNELSKEPDLTYKNVNAGATWKVEKSVLVNLNFDMIDKTLNGTLKLVRQE